MISDIEKFKEMIETARMPLAELSLSLATQGHPAKDIAILFLQTGFLMLKDNYGLEKTKEICIEEIEEFEKCWRMIN